MTEHDLGLFGANRRGNWIRLRTMIVLRWFAIFGQLAALFAGQYLYDLDLPMGLCILVVGIAVIANLVAMFIFPQNRRLKENEHLAMVTFDLLQLGLLLYLTGGLHNPFSILIVGPVTVSAAALSLRSTLFVGATAIITVSVLAGFHLDLHTSQGFILRIPEVFMFGVWAAIVIAIVFLGIYSRWITTEMHAMSDALQATQMALAREQKLTDLGGVVAAAAHELGTPLATIKLTSAEMIDELASQPDLQDDARLIRNQADRCRDILRSMGRSGKDDLHLRQAPLSTVVHEAAEPHLDRGKTIHFSAAPETGHDAAIPSVLRQPEIIHGLRNLVQNAVDFSAQNVWVSSRWSDRKITVRVADDGRGFPAHLIGRIGDPFMPRRKTNRDTSQRPEYEGMGLGLFIAKTLLERSGASLSFANGTDARNSGSAKTEQSGAIVEITWPRKSIDAVSGDQAIEIGENSPFNL